MNKTIIININGIIFHIEEDAYELLKAYMTDVKKHFAYSKDSEEIVGDIENRIAEMFSESLAEEKKQVIILKDVELVIAQMGAVNEFTDDEEPVFTETVGEKKLYRDLDDKWLGGVCAGIAHYFNAKTSIVRMIALLTFFIGGSGLMIYIILWIVMPKAKTRAEKMAMKGEPFNLHNFKRNLDEEVEALKQNFNNAHNEARPFFSYAGGAAKSLIQLLLAFLGKVFKAIIKIGVGFIILIGAIALLATFIALFSALGFWNSSEINIFPFNAINPEYRTSLFLSAFFLVTIPIAALLFFAFRILTNRKILTRTASFVMLIIWLTALVSGIYYGSSLAAEFSEEATFQQTIALKPHNSYQLELNEAILLSKEDSIEYGIEGAQNTRSITINGARSEVNAPRNIRLTIIKGDTDVPLLIEEFSAKGPTFKMALNYARQISYQFTQKDSILNFSGNIHTPLHEIWRDQSIKLKLVLPANTLLYIDGKLNYYLDDANLHDCQPDGVPEETVSEWAITDTGLKCVNDSLYQRRQYRN